MGIACFIAWHTALVGRTIVRLKQTSFAISPLSCASTILTTIYAEPLRVISVMLCEQMANGDHGHSHMFARRHDCTVVIHRPDDERVYVGEGARQIHFYWQNQNHYDYLIPAGRVAIAPQPAATPPRQSNPRRTAGRASGKVKEQRRNQRKPRAQAPKPPEPTKQNQVAGEKRKGK